MSRRTPPDHTDPKATAGLTARRRKRGLPVGDLAMPERTAERIDRPGTVAMTYTPVRGR